jgi:threonine/homoserine/homoserine lactone efflux protein
MNDYPAIQGVILGLTLAVLVGPAFFTLIQTSMHRGFRPGLLLSIGIILSDMTLVALTYLGAVQILNYDQNKNYFGVLAAAILIIFGIFTFTRKVVVEGNELPDIRIKQPRALTYLIKGYFLNIANPFVIIFWMGVMGFVSQQYGVDKRAVLSFFSATFLTIFSTDLLKSFIGGKIKGYLNPSVLLWVNRVVGVALILFGLILIIRVYQMF